MYQRSGFKICFKRGSLRIVQCKTLVEKKEERLFRILFHVTSTNTQDKVVLLSPSLLTCRKVVPTCHCVQFFIIFSYLFKICSFYFPLLVLSLIFLNYFILPLLTFFLYLLFISFVFGSKSFYFLIIMEASKINNNHSLKRSLYNMFENPASLDSCLKGFTEVWIVLNSVQKCLVSLLLV